MGNKCGGIREPCLSDGDPRFDPNSEYGLVEQNPIWRRNAGLFESVGKTYWGNGTEVGLQDVGEGFVLDMGNVRQYTNVTINGTRLSYESRMYFKGGEGSEYPGKGWTEAAMVYGHSTHELDGRMITLADAGDPDGTNMVTYVVGDDTTFAVGGVTETRTGKEFGTISKTCLDAECENSSEVHQNYIGGVLYNFRVWNVRRINTAGEFLEAKSATEADTDVLEMFSEGPDAPPGSPLALYPSEDAWCAGDPSCPVSPYQNPTTPVRGGYLALVIICAAVLALAAFFAAHGWLSKRKERRVRTLFANRVAQTIQIRASPEQLTPELLEKEFRAIDESGDGYIQKGELWEFLRTGKAGTIAKSDFNSLWACIDADDSGRVDFLEFCAFMGKCHGEYDVARNRRSLIASRASQKLGSMRDIEIIGGASQSD